MRSLYLRARVAVKAIGLLFLFSILISPFLTGCSGVSALGIRGESSGRNLLELGFEREYVSAQGFNLLTYRKIEAPGKPVKIYIEGDGSAWLSRRRFSDDPTPREPIALYLAAKDPAANVAYIARPGQFPENGIVKCDPTYWSARRFSPEVIAAISEAIDRIKLYAGAEHIELIGYSGGGALAVLVAARRDDVISLRTVAGNLDHEGLSVYHKTSPLHGSLNPIDYALSVKKIPQRHFAGAKDKVIPVEIIRRFAKASGDNECNNVVLVKDCGHSKGWVKAWPGIIADNSWASRESRP